MKYKQEREMMFEKIEEANTPAEMRAAIEKAGRNHVVIRRVLDTARQDSLSPEDTYTLLAYIALQVLADTQQQYMTLASLTPDPQAVMTDKPQA